MILYHGSDREIRKPDILHSRAEVDFGRGFYTTPLLEQAENWCKKFQRRGRDGVINIYRLDEKALSECRTLQFDAYSEEWLDFIVKCRRGEDRSDYDLVSGGVANDRVFNTVELYGDGLIDKKEALRRLHFEKPNKQIAFRNAETIERYLSFEGSKKL